jgi:2,3-dihydroxybenzoate-AMP ligase
VLGEKMCAYVILEQGTQLALEELSENLLSHEIAKFKLPERLEVIDEFPLSTFGKVSKKDLVAMISAQLEAEKAA